MQEIASLAHKKVTLQRNDTLNAKGRVDTNIYYVESGSLKVYILDNQEEKIIRFGYKGDLIVLLDSFLTQKPTQLCIEAIKKTKLKVISRKVFTEYLKKQDNSHTVWSSILENLIIQQMERERDLLTSSPRQRYLRVLQRSPRLFQEIPARYIANYLRMSPETLSRLKKS